MIDLLIFAAGMITTLVLLGVMAGAARLYVLADRIAAEVERDV
jgi:hypothetical protein